MAIPICLWCQPIVLVSALSVGKEYVRVHVGACPTIPENGVLSEIERDVLVVNSMELAGIVVWNWYN